eukprot:Rmarinus@m.12998
MLELKMLNTLGWQLQQPTAVNFYRQILLTCDDLRLSAEIKTLSEMLLRETYRDYTLLRYRPSEIAASVIACAILIKKQPSKLAKLAKIVRRPTKIISECCQHVLRLSRSISPPTPLSLAEVDRLFCDSPEADWRADLKKGSCMSSKETAAIPSPDASGQKVVTEFSMKRITRSGLPVKRTLRWKASQPPAKRCCER